MLENYHRSFDDKDIAGICACFFLWVWDQNLSPNPKKKSVDGIVQTKADYDE